MSSIVPGTLSAQGHAVSLPARSSAGGAAGATALALVAGPLAAAQAGGWCLAALWLLGAVLGVAPYHASLGFADRCTTQVRAQLLLLGLAVVSFHPAIVAGRLFAQPERRLVFPIGLALPLGALPYGIGMQLAGGCTSGTLYVVGGGAARPLLILASFIAGASIAATGYEHWAALPRRDAIPLPARLGLDPRRPPGNALGVLLRPLFRFDPAGPSRLVLSVLEARC